jgi:hypothetical protein
MRITSVLRVEHRLLRVMMEAMSAWLAKATATAPMEMGQRVALLAELLVELAAQED